MFTYKYYDLLLKTFQDNGYEFGSFDCFNAYKTVYLRHDVDFDIFGVLALAGIECDNNVNSIWFFQPDNDLYNMINRQSLDIILELVKMGHQVGLHIDASVYSEGYDELVDGIRLLFGFYGNYIPLVKIISFHRPAPFLLRDYTIPGFISTYEECYFKTITYISDSNRREFWKEKHLFGAIKEGRSIQLLTHPLWWKNEELSRDEIAEYLRETVKIHIADKSLKLNCKLYGD